MTTATQTKRAPRRRILWLIALAVSAVTLFSILVPLQAAFYGTVLPLAMLLGVGVAGAPLLAVPYPRIAIAVFCLSAFALGLAISPDRDAAWPWPWSVPGLIAFAVFVFVVTVQYGARLGAVPWAASMAGSLVSTILLPDAASPGPITANLVVTASITAVTYLIAVLLVGRIRVGDELNRSRELTAIEHSRRVIVEERARIARELHDVVAHSMSVIQVQASTARYRIPGLPPIAAAEFDDLAATARTSLTEMRRLLGVLRTEDQAAELSPQQGISDIPALVETVRRAGADVTLALDVPENAPSPAVQITAFRLVQEALTNAVRHAPGAAIDVELSAHTSFLTIRVHSAEGSATLPSPGGGHGLRGMKERVALLAGSLIVGPDQAGGWTVTATLPLTETEGSRE